jgi:hypothetical protein
MRIVASDEAEDPESDVVSLYAARSERMIRDAAELAKPPASKPDWKLAGFAIVAIYESPDGKLAATQRCADSGDMIALSAHVAAYAREIYEST